MGKVSLPRNTPLGLGFLTHPSLSPSTSTLLELTVLHTNHQGSAKLPLRVGMESENWKGSDVRIATQFLFAIMDAHSGLPK